MICLNLFFRIHFCSRSGFCSCLEIVYETITQFSNDGVVPSLCNQLVIVLVSEEIRLPFSLLGEGILHTYSKLCLFIDKSIRPIIFFLSQGTDSSSMVTRIYTKKYVHRSVSPPLENRAHGASSYPIGLVFKDIHYNVVSFRCKIETAVEGGIK